MATPSTFGSLENARCSRSRSGTWRRRRSAQARRSASSKALSRLIMGTRCRTGWNSPRGAAPTVCVGESGVSRVGYAASSSRSSSTRRSYSASGISGESSTLYRSLWYLITWRSSVARAAASGGGASPAAGASGAMLRRRCRRRPRRRDQWRRTGRPSARERPAAGARRTVRSTRPPYAPVRTGQAGRGH